jgi:hypothetical protein
VEQTTTEIVLEGSATVDAEGGAGFDPFGPPAAAPEKAGADGKVRFLAKRDMRLVEKGEFRDLRLTEDATIERFVGDRKEMSVRADDVHAVLEGKDILLVTADGAVVAKGRPEIEGGRRPDVTATGDSFKFLASESRALLTGRPARAELREEAGGENAIEASRLVFTGVTEGDGTLVAEENVEAVVYLAGQPSEKPQPFGLECDHLEIRPAPKPEGDEPVDPESRIASLEARGAVVLSGEDWEARGDVLTYAVKEEKRITLTGRPARASRTRKIGKGTYEDSFRSEEIHLALAGRRLMSFESPGGGRVLMFRPWGRSGPSVIGDAAPAKSGFVVERFSTSAVGPISFDAKTGLVRLEKEATVEQAGGEGEDFTTVASFTADLLKAWIIRDEADVDQLTRAEGRGHVTGGGDGWELTCNSFEIDLVNTQTIVNGTPARVKTGGRTIVATRAVYDYARKQWRELFEPSGGGR